MEGCAGYPTAQPLIFTAQFPIRNPQPNNLRSPAQLQSYAALFVGFADFFFVCPYNF